MPLAPQLFRLLRQRRRGNSALLQQPFVSDQNLAGRPLGRSLPARCEIETPSARQNQAAAFGGFDHRGARADARFPAPRWPPVAAVHSHPPDSFPSGTGTTDTTRGLPSVSVPVLSTTSVSTFSMHLERFRILDQHAGLRAASRPHHDRNRSRQPQRARTSNDQHRHRIDQRMRQPRLRPEQTPRRKRQNAIAITAGTNQPATRSARR